MLDAAKRTATDWLTCISAGHEMTCVVHRLDGPLAWRAFVQLADARVRDGEFHPSVARPDRRSNPGGDLSPFRSRRRPSCHAGAHQRQAARGSTAFLGASGCARRVIILRAGTRWNTRFNV